MKIGRIAFMAFALVIPAAVSFAQGGAAALDISGNYATEPAGGFGGTAGIEIGGIVDFDRLGVDIRMENVRTAARAAFGYYDWDDSVSGVDISYRRIPFFLGGRFIVPIAAPFLAYGDLGLEVSFDRKEGVSSGNRVSDSEVNLGLRPQIGIIYPVSDRSTLGAGIAWHVVSDPYLTLGFTVGFTLGTP